MGAEYRRLLLILAITVARQAASCFGADASLPSVRELEREALKSRRSAIRSGRVVMTSEQVHEGRPDRRHFEYIFDGKALFWQWRAILDDGSLGPPSSVIVSADQKSFIESNASANDRVAVMRRPIASGEFGECYPILCDVRHLGMSADSPGLQCKFGMEGVLNRADRRNLRVARGDGDLTGTWKIEGDVPDGRHLSIWLAPNQGMSVRRAEARFQAPDGDYHFFTDVTLKAYERGGIWFPKTVRHWHTWNGGPPLEVELNSVEDAEFNLPIEPSTFTYDGLHLAPGRNIVDQTKRFKAYYWDGERVRPRTPEMADALTSPTRPYLKWLFGGLSLMLAAAGAYVLVRRRQAA